MDLLRYDVNFAEGETHLNLVSLPVVEECSYKPICLPININDGEACQQSLFFGHVFTDNRLHILKPWLMPTQSLLDYHLHYLEHHNAATEQPLVIFCSVEQICTGDLQVLTAEYPRLDLTFAIPLQDAMKLTYPDFHSLTLQNIKIGFYSKSDLKRKTALIQNMVKINNKPDNKISISPNITQENLFTLFVKFNYLACVRTSLINNAPFYCGFKYT